MTKKSYTYEVLNNYLMNNGRLNETYVAELVQITCYNEKKYQDIIIGKTDSRMTIKNVAIVCLKHFIDTELKFNKHEGYECTNKHLTDYDKEHDNTLSRVLEMVEEYIKFEREEHAKG